MGEYLWYRTTFMSLSALESDTKVYWKITFQYDSDIRSWDREVDENDIEI